MIEFSGNFSNECKKFMLKRLAATMFVIFLISSVLIGIPIVIGIIKGDLLLFVMLPVLIAIPIVAAASPYMYKNKTLKDMIPKSITIDEEKAFWIELEKQTLFKEFSQVKKIIDNGRWYTIIVRLPKISGLICQKDLITKGTIDDFEKLFEGKIVRKLK